MAERPELTCAVCLGTFNSTTKRPIDVGCHSFCASCYDAGVSRGSFRYCPECRQPCANVHTNYSLLRCVEAMEASGSLPRPPPPPNHGQRHATSTASCSSIPTDPLCQIPRVLEQALLSWRWLAPILGTLYIVSPVDLIPDFIPILGWVDDILAFLLMVLPAILQLLRSGPHGRQDRQHRERGD